VTPPDDWTPLRTIRAAAVPAVAAGSRCTGPDPRPIGRQDLPATSPAPRHPRRPRTRLGPRAGPRYRGQSV